MNFQFRKGVRECAVVAATNVTCKMLPIYRGRYLLTLTRFGLVLTLYLKRSNYREETNVNSS